MRRDLPKNPLSRWQSLVWRLLRITRRQTTMCRGRSYLTWSPTPRSGNPWTGNPDLPLPCASLNAAKAHGGGTAWNWPGILWEQPGKAESFAAKTMETENVTRTNFMSEFCRSEEHTSELQSLMRISYAVFCLKKKTTRNNDQTHKN